MQIITYATQISMQPKRFICGLYHGTKTLDNIERNGVFVLQYLADHQYRLSMLLGKTSGNTIDKIARLEKRKLITTWKNHIILKDALAVIELTTIQSFEAGDHKAFLCDVSDFKNLQEGKVLTLDDLREHKLIRI
jgi:flavin reductase (DIM6/NTAB) family NADH-FMN oxidoreductase RutF